MYRDSPLYFSSVEAPAQFKTTARAAYPSGSQEGSYLLILFHSFFSCIGAVFLRRWSRCLCASCVWIFVLSVPIYFFPPGHTLPRTTPPVFRREIDIPTQSSHPFPKQPSRSSRLTGPPGICWESAAVAVHRGALACCAYSIRFAPLVHDHTIYVLGAIKRVSRARVRAVLHNN